MAMNTRNLLDSAGRVVALGKKIGSGGEGRVFSIPGHDQLVAKVYREPASTTKARKLRAMVRAWNRELAWVAAWPRETLHESRNGPVVGVLLPRLEEACPVHELYSPAHRRVRFPEADWRFLVRAASNVAATCATLHARGIVIGDVNPGNVFVTRNALARLIDCDSFQVCENGKHFVCEVGVPHFTPPELHGRSFRDVVRTPNHDAFGLAVLVFHLLFMGRHPFAGRYGGKEEMPIERAIREFRYAYGTGPASQAMSPPPLCLPIQAAPPEVRELFEQAFGESGREEMGRPSGERWAHRLAEMEKELTCCEYDPGHWYSRHLSDCPWCGIIEQGGPNFFSTAGGSAVYDELGNFNAMAAWKQIVAVPEPPLKPTVRPPGDRRIEPAPIPAGADASYQFTTMIGRVAVLAALASPIGLAFPPLLLFAVPVSIIFGIWRLVGEMYHPRETAKRQRRHALKALQAELAEQEATWKQAAAAQRARFQSARERLAKTNRAYAGLHDEWRARLEALHADIPGAVLRAHLRRHFIREAVRDIARLEPRHLPILDSYGIETAMDIDKENVPRLPGIEDALAVSLWAWRTSVESGFRYEPTTEVPSSEVEAAKLDFRRHRFRLEQQLKRGPRELWAVTNAANTELAEIERRIGQLQYKITQAQANLRLCEIQPEEKRTLIGFGVIAIGVPLLAAGIRLAWVLIAAAL